MDYIRLPISDYPDASLEALVGSTIVPMAQVGDFYQCEFPALPSGSYIIQVREVGSEAWEAIGEVYWTGCITTDTNSEPVLVQMMVRDFVFACRHSGEQITYVQDGTPKTVYAIVHRGEPAELKQVKGATDESLTVDLPRHATEGVALVKLRADRISVAPRYGAAPEEFVITSVIGSDEASISVRLR